MADFDAVRDYLTGLQDRICAAVEVADGGARFAEDRWQALTIRGVRFRVTKPVGRCVMATIDPATLTHTTEPIRTLARRRRVDGRTLFAVNLVPEGSATISVGDEVDVS